MRMDKREQGMLQSGLITSKIGEKCKLRTNEAISVKGASAKTVKEGSYYITTFKTDAGKSYLIKKK